MVQLKSRPTILAIGFVITAVGTILFFVSGGSFSQTNTLQIGLLVFQVGAGILVVEGVIGFALGRDNRAKAGYSATELLPLADSFDQKAMSMIAELGGLDAEAGGPMGESMYASRFPYQGRMKTSAMVRFNDWLQARLDAATEDCRALAHFLDQNEVEAIRGPLRRIAPLATQLKQAERSRTRYAARWAACMFALDGIRQELAQLRKALDKHLPPAKK